MKKERIKSYIEVKNGEKVVPIKEQTFDDLLTKHPVNGWYEDKRK